MRLVAILALALASLLAPPPAGGASNCSGASNKISYAYDKVSNRTQEVRTCSVGNTGTIDSTYNAADQLTETDDGTNTTTYTYDDNGNQAAAGDRSFSYGLAEELVDYEGPLNDEVERVFAGRELGA